jgi:hypothetical protein
MVPSKPPASLSVSKRPPRDLRPLLCPSKGLPLRPPSRPSQLMLILLPTASTRKLMLSIFASKHSKIDAPPLVHQPLAVNTNNSNHTPDSPLAPLPPVTPTSNVATAKSWATVSTNATCAVLLGLPWSPPTGLPTNRPPNRLAFIRS